MYLTWQHDNTYLIHNRMCKASHNTCELYNIPVNKCVAHNTMCKSSQNTSELYNIPVNKCAAHNTMCKTAHKKPTWQQLCVSALVKCSSCHPVRWSQVGPTAPSGGSCGAQSTLVPHTPGSCPSNHNQSQAQTSSSEPWQHYRTLGHL